MLRIVCVARLRIILHDRLATVPEGRLERRT
jgi:hypothetical protein